jgi:hypothetical protein
MAITPAVLADGQLPSTKNTLYTAGADTYVKFFHVHNTGANPQTILIYAKTSGTSRIIGRAVLGQYESADIIDKDDALTLNTGDLIEGQTTDATTVDYVITGATA